MTPEAMRLRRVEVGRLRAAANPPERQCSQPAVRQSAEQAAQHPAAPQRLVEGHRSTLQGCASGDGAVEMQLERGRGLSNAAPRKMEREAPSDGAIQYGGGRKLESPRAQARGAEEQVAAYTQHRTALN